MFGHVCRSVAESTETRFERIPIHNFRARVRLHVGFIIIVSKTIKCAEAFGLRACIGHRLQVPVPNSSKRTKTLKPRRGRGPSYLPGGVGSGS